MSAGFGDALNQYVWRMQSYNGKLFVGTFDISGLADPVAQFVNGDMLTRSADEWKTQIDYVKTFIDLMKGSKMSVPGVSNFALASSVITLDKLASKGGVNDIKSTEQFYKALKAVYGVYVKVHDQLPAEITSKLDTILNEENVDQFYYFTFVCKKLSQSKRGFDMFVTEDGKNFETITRNGLGDKYNHGLRTFAVTDAGLCVGTANPFYGAQVWRIDEVETDDAPTQIDIIKDIVNKLFELIKDQLGNIIG